LNVPTVFPPLDLFVSARFKSFSRTPPRVFSAASLLFFFSPTSFVFDAFKITNTQTKKHLSPPINLFPWFRASVFFSSGPLTTISPRVVATSRKGEPVFSSKSVTLFVKLFYRHARFPCPTFLLSIFLCPFFPLSHMACFLQLLCFFIKIPPDIPFFFLFFPPVSFFFGL